MLVPTNENKETIKKYEERLIKIKDLIRSVTKHLDDYDEKYMQIKINSDDELPLKETMKIPTITIVVRAIFHEIGKCYILDDCLYEL